jgi:hypothetical protein
MRSPAHVPPIAASLILPAIFWGQKYIPGATIRTNFILFGFFFFSFWIFSFRYSLLFLLSFSFSISSYSSLLISSYSSPLLF